jgi:hypothetical protein
MKIYENRPFLVVVQFDDLKNARSLTPTRKLKKTLAR